MSDYFFPGNERPFEEVVAAYVDELGRERQSTDWATWHVSNLVFLGRSDEAFRVIAAAARLTSDLPTLASLGAGDLETLLVNQGVDFIDRVEGEARANPNFAVALSNVWSVDERIEPRLRALIAETARPVDGGSA